MATATIERPEPEVTISLTLTENEALYVLWALVHTHPTKAAGFGEYNDPVYTALSEAFREAGIDDFRGADFVPRVGG